jgi:hypothetical protein
LIFVKLKPSIMHTYSFEKLEVWKESIKLAIISKELLIKSMLYEIILLTLNGSTTNV